LIYFQTETKSKKVTTMQDAVALLFYCTLYNDSSQVVPRTVC